MRTVLIVDDDASIISLLKLLLENAGYRVCSANNALCALSALRNDEVDMMVSDVHMPGMDGYQLLEQIRKDKKFAAMPVALLTIQSDAASVLKGMEIGADEYLPKPFTKSEFLACVKRMEAKISGDQPEEQHL